eukprot:s7552_g1.t1
MAGSNGRKVGGSIAPDRVVDEAYCTLNEAGHPASFSEGRVSQQSGSQYEKLVTNVVNGFSRRLKAMHLQTPEERTAVKTLKQQVATFLRDHVSDNAAQRVAAGGVGEEEADIDAVFHGSFRDLLRELNEVTEAKVIATCTDVTCVLVEACSDSRFVAMKLLQIETQCRIVQRGGFLVRDDLRNLQPQNLCPESTGYAIVFNRAALQIDIESVLSRLGLTYVQELQQKGKFHIAFLQADRVLPAALKVASEARAEANEARAEANEARAEAREARAKVDRWEKDLAGTTSAPSTVWVRELDSKDGTIIAKSRQDPEGEDELERAFKVESPQDHPRLNDVDDLAKAIKQRKPITLKDVEADQIDIYLQEAGEWQRVAGASTSLRQDTSEQDCYGFFPRRKGII